MMDKLERLKLLFLGDDSLPAFDADHLLPSGCSSSHSDALNTDSSLPRQIPGERSPSFDDFSVARSYRSQSPSPEALNTMQDEIRVFCPIHAISRLPYRYFKGDLSQLIAKKFFDEGKFWQRTWNLHYIHPPTDISPRPLLLVPVNQVQKLVDEINATFACRFELPSDIEAGLMIPFVEAVAPEPNELGVSTSRDMKDNLEAGIPPPVGASADEKIVLAYDAEAESLLAVLREWISAAIDATKRQTKGVREKKRIARIQRRREWTRVVKRTQCYLGLRPKHSPETPADNINADFNWEELKMANQKLGLRHKEILGSLDIMEPAPHKFAYEPVFISIDIEANEYSHDQVTEVGISILDTLDLNGFAPGVTAQSWLSKIRSRHFRIYERSHVVNNKFLAGCPDKFEFGQSEFVRIKDIVDAVEACFRPPYSAQTAMGPACDKVRLSETIQSIAPYKLRPRNIVLVGHNVQADISYLRNLGCTIFDYPLQPSLVVEPEILQPKSTPRILESLDTAHLFQLLKRDASPRSLGSILLQLEIPCWYLHNAGNDARYTLEILVSIVLKSRLIDDEPLDENDTSKAWWSFGTPILRAERERNDSVEHSPTLMHDLAWKAEVERRVAEVTDDNKRHVLEDCEAWEIATGWKDDDWMDEEDLDGGMARGIIA